MSACFDIREEEILQRARQGERDAMRELYRISVPYLSAVCSRYIPDRDAAKDVLQEAYIRIFASLDRFVYRGEGSLRAWTKRIVVNQSLKWLRDKNSRPLLYAAQIPDLPEEEDPPIAYVPMSVIQEMIQHLPDGYRTVFNLFVFEKLSHREIGRLLGIKENSSASQYLRARALLARQIKAYYLQHPS